MSSSHTTIYHWSQGHFCLCGLCESGKSLLCPQHRPRFGYFYSLSKNSFHVALDELHSYFLDSAWGKGISFILWNKPPSIPLTSIWENLFWLPKEILFFRDTIWFPREFLLRTNFIKVQGSSSLINIGLPQNQSLNAQWLTFQLCYKNLSESFNTADRHMYRSCSPRQ